MSIPFDMTQPPERVDEEPATPHPMWCRPITIHWLGRNEFEVSWDGKTTGSLCWEEVFAATVAVMGGVGRGAPLRWFKTADEWQALREDQKRRIERAEAEEAKRLTLTLDVDLAESVTSGLADLLCWAQGFNAARQDGAGPSGLDAARTIKSLIERRLAAKKQEHPL